MKVILLKQVSNLGLAGTVVNVSDGYAANYLIPKKLASSLVNLAVKKVVAEKNLPINEQGKKLLSGVANLKIVIYAKTNEQGKLYEAIKAGQVASLLRQKKKINIKSEQIHFAKPIKELGEHIIDVKVGNQTSSFKLTVEKI